MKWKDHKLATYDPVQAHKTAIETKPGQQLVVKKPYDPVSVHERVMAVKAMPKTGSVVKKKRKRRKVKDVSQATKQSAQKVISSMSTLMNKPISAAVIRKHPLPTMRVVKSGN